LTTAQGNYQNIQPFPSHSLQGRPEAFNMAALGIALPNAGYQNYNDQSANRYPPNVSPTHPYQTQGVPQFSGLPTMVPTTTSLPYNAHLPQQYPGMFAQGQIQSSHTSIGAGPPMYQQYYVQPQHYGPQTQMYPGGLGGAIPGHHGGRGPYGGESQVPMKQRSEYTVASSSSGPSGRAGVSSVVRGPPRKPRQSGHAIWIGNLPPQTALMSLVHHVCKETAGLESLFLIAKSNCAFANYKDEASCAAAQSKIHDSKFQTVRLVSRLRRSSAATTSDPPIPTGPAALVTPPVARSPSPEMEKGAKSSQLDSDPPDSIALENKPTRDRFFVVKSLTVEDLELSVRNGIWATQSHNEEALNKAYLTAENVYLIFSANKSGEYFGFARMASPINDDPAAAIEFAPQAQIITDPELPKAISTPATDFAPKGRIIDDSARGTIFWEAEREDDEEEEEDSGENDSGGEVSSPTASKAWGKPFQVEWMSTTRLPFYRTRGLRNPWNSNREVKIARDGTELETSVGRRLIGLFHRVPSPVAPMPLTGGYPGMRPY